MCCSVCVKLPCVYYFVMSVVYQFTCTEDCPDWAPEQLPEETEYGTALICVTWDIYAAETGGLR